ncbi:hypothetical protein N836_29595 [Leptolyngbya sp. Heron Island J]|nr:hypothetical protein N836_29595 [Leptolyngbya sp. Heron Island J]
MLPILGMPLSVKPSNRKGLTDRCIFEIKNSQFFLLLFLGVGKSNFEAFKVFFSLSLLLKQFEY